MTSAQAPSPETGTQIQILESSQQYLLLILLGILISYGLLSQQLRQVLCPQESATAGEGSTLSLRLLSNLLILCALLFFFCLSERTAKTPATSPRQAASAQVNLAASGLVLGAGLLRLWDLLYLQSSD